MLRQFCSQDLVGVNLQYQVNVKSGNAIIASAYLPYDSVCPPPTQELRDLVVYTEPSGLELLIGCDANAQHICWGSSKCNPRGEKLFDFITSTGLMTANVGCAPKFVEPIRSEVIHLTICTFKLLELIRNWRVLGEVSLSDHHYLEFSLTIAGEQLGIQRRYHRKRTKFNELLGHIVEFPGRLKTPLAIED